MSYTLKWIAVLSVLSAVLCQGITPAMRFSSKVTVPTAPSITQASPKVKYRKILIKVGAKGKKILPQIPTRTTNVTTKVVRTVRPTTGGGVIQKIVTRGVTARPVIQQVIQGPAVTRKVVIGRPGVVQRPAAAGTVQLSSNAFAWKNFMTLGGGSGNMS